MSSSPSRNSTAAEAPPPPSTSTDAVADGSSKKVRKPYTITKSRESWTEEEHDKFLEALQLICVLYQFEWRQPLLELDAAPSLPQKHQQIAKKEEAVKEKVQKRNTMRLS